MPIRTKYIMKSMNKPLILTGRFKIIEILIKTQANGWKNLKPGDIIEISLELTNNSQFGRVYQSHLNIHAIGSDYEWKWADTLSFAHTRLNTNFKVEQL